jgi:circadian clock protein KaiC
MTDRLSSGSERLDAVLGGGLPANGIVLIGGKPGTGKTILAQQYVFHNASSDRPAVYLTTVSEPLEKLLRYGQSALRPVAGLLRPRRPGHPGAL